VNREEAMERLVNPGRLFSPELGWENLRGNLDFIKPLSLLLTVLRQSQYWSENRIRELQNLRLRNFFKLLHSNSGFWKAHLEASGVDLFDDPLSNLKLLPILDRGDLRRWGDDIFIFSKVGRYYYQSTSGSTGMPIKFWRDERDEKITHFSYWLRHQIFENVDITNFFSRKFGVCLGKAGVAPALKDFFCTFYPTLNDLENKDFRERIYKKMIEADPVFLTGFPSLLLKFAREASADNPNLTVLCIKASGEPMAHEDEAFVKNTFNAPFIRSFSCDEVGSIGLECLENRGRYHLNSEKVIMEIVDVEGNAVENGTEGEMVLTALDRITTPIVRYKNGDYARIIPGQCSCGRTLTLFEPRGRRGDEIILPSGKKVKVLQLQILVSGTGLAKKADQYQFKQEARDRLKLLVVMRAGSAEKTLGGALEEHIRSELSSLFMNVKMSLEIEYVNNIVSTEGGKYKLLMPLKE
jgi:phenylacetate-CoA ligase